MEIIPDAVKDSALSKPLIVKKETPPAKDSVVTRSVFSKYTQFSDGVRVNLDSGIKIVVLFSLDCEHCLETATKLNRLRSASKLPLCMSSSLARRNDSGFFNAAGGAFP
jgi:protein-disulfide isomerase